MSPVVIAEVRGLTGRLAFLRAARALRREPQFTPDLAPEFLRQTSSKNPFFRHSEMALYVARRDGAVVGRVAAIVDSRANEIHSERVAAFGYFEVADGDAEATRALVDAAAAFGRARGMTTLRGPIDLS
ncbi:MAG TPA: N-acetyltransferase, partial [Planctomycetota bacterium]|nr:N-acetyltransferase [Planctomycetota bacterium]